MGLFIAAPETVHGHVRIQLGGRQTRMTEKLLDGAEICAAVEQMRRSAVPKGVRTACSGITERLQGFMDLQPDGPLVDPPASGAQEERGATLLGHPRRSSPSEPVVDGVGGRHTVGDGALLPALAQHHERAALRIEVIDVETHELTDADACPVEQFEHGPALQLARFSPLRALAERLEQGHGLRLAQDRRQVAGAFRGPQPQGRIRGYQVLAHGPVHEGPHGGGPPRDRGA